ncbi:hypothetical protein [Glutamicibacter protophormiae]|uniref:Neutral/alkaline non-lysosomal ceramidase N-terminal domain-containing protein n=1 Tax=Glutamicibacter protophormiae TaxID=37930 RepID=A0ABS4XS25_GLUPR|nr:hypothetical protein [Glutamicibacter protophormiae]MBP2399314.1 hypothetical protein [Glutamicibacter protophormiae]GGM00675.1 hypothetical protein GCM10010038_33450 [Glutamicibacter protophormiae]
MEITEKLFVNNSKIRANSITVDITPLGRVDQGCGIAAEEIDLDGAQETLEANLLALWVGAEEEPLLIVTLDLLYPGKYVRSIIEKVSELPSDRILVAASHTHAAPMTDASKPDLGEPNPDYMNALSSVLARAVTDVLDPIKAVDVRFKLASGEADHSVNRRRTQLFHLGRKVRGRHISLSPNPMGSRDESLILGSLVDPDDRVVSYIWNYSCHPVSHPTPRKNSAHFIGAVRRGLRKEGATAVLFLQGFSGDTRPNGSVTKLGLISRLRNAGVRYGFATMSFSAYDEWTESLVHLVLQLQQTLDQVDVADIVVSRKSISGEKFSEGQLTPVIFQAWRFGTALTIVGVSAEAVSEYSSYVRELTSGRLTMCVGCMDDVYGYLPTLTMVKEGGYEGGEFCGAFGLGNLSLGIEEAAKQGFYAVLSSIAPNYGKSLSD